MYRNKAILDLAREHSCAGCNKNDGTTVAAHSNQLKHGKGKGIKAHDCFVAYCCDECHEVIDSSKAPAAVRVGLWEWAHKRSVPLFQHLLNEEGRSLLAAAQ
jgi:hypothetical protein